MTPYYDITEYNTALKPFFLETLIKKDYDMEFYIKTGQFNLGYVGVSGNHESMQLLKWRQSVCVKKRIRRVEHKFLVDRFRAAIFPSFMEKTCYIGYIISQVKTFETVVRTDGLLKAYRLTINLIFRVIYRVI